MCTSHQETSKVPSRYQTTTTKILKILTLHVSMKKKNPETCLKLLEFQ